MPTFIFLWLGQTISLIGSGLTSFALGVSIYQTNSSIAQFSLIYFCTELPAILIAPLSGAIADKYDKRWVMIVSDTGAGFSTLIMAWLFWSDRWEISYIYLAIAFGSLCRGFQWPAYYATPTLLVSQKDFGRANGLIQLGEAAAKLFSPALAGILVGKIAVEGVMGIDFASFIFALLVLAIVRFPKYTNHRNRDIETSQQTWWQDLTFGWKYLLARRGLFLLLTFFVVVNFALGITQVLITPMILGFANAQVLGNILSFGGCGWLLGAVIMSIWGGPKRRIKGIICGEIMLGCCMVIMGLKPSAILISITLFIGLFNIPIFVGCANAIRQIKVATEAQGRVFAIWGAIAYASFPLAYLVASPLAERVFNPLLKSDGRLVNSLGLIMGVGETRGIGLLFVTLGIAIITIAIAAYQNPDLRYVEDQKC
ncbi:MFS transporter [Calothrix rhizosoleniae]|uniref:MFS transporter n=1 Tax=Calothrix rhizosoleniae TaxID=888997 RepID=UPI000B49A498|nr:MFS transporter [Calothrix rhizosoleniae]